MVWVIGIKGLSHGVKSLKYAVCRGRIKDGKGMKTKKSQLSQAETFRDSYRIQTYNLLIRSQMLYSVELRSRLCFQKLVKQSW